MLRSRQLISGLYELTELPTLIHSKKMDEKKKLLSEKPDPAEYRLVTNTPTRVNEFRF